MLGHSHALSGAVTGLAAGSLVLHEPPGPLALLAALGVLLWRDAGALTAHVHALTIRSNP